MMIGILGTTNKATTLAKIFKRAGTVTVSDPGHADRAERLAAELGAGTKAAAPYRQAMTSDILIFAMDWRDLDTALTQLGPLPNQVVIDAMLPEAAATQNGAQTLAHKLDSPHVVEAFVEPPPWNGAVNLCADDPDARARVTKLLRECGIETRDGGPLASAGTNERLARALAS